MNKPTAPLPSDPEFKKLDVEDVMRKTTERKLF